MPWIGPFKLRDYIDRVGGLDPLPPDDKPGLYVFSRKLWVGNPIDLLYLGSGHSTENTSLLNRIAREVADTLGFHGKVAALGSGGFLLSKFCKREGIKPLDLYLGWRTVDDCPVPYEQELYDDHKNKLSRELQNTKRPGRNRACKSLKCP